MYFWEIAKKVGFLAQTYFFNKGKKIKAVMHIVVANTMLDYGSLIIVWLCHEWIGMIKR